MRASNFSIKALFLLHKLVSEFALAPLGERGIKSSPFRSLLFLSRTKKRGGFLPLFLILQPSRVRQAVKANFKERIVRVKFLKYIPPVMPLMKVDALVLKDHPLNCLYESVSFSFIIFVFLHLAPPFSKDSSKGT